MRVFLFLGTDIESPYKGRTDTVILVFVNSETGNVSLVSIPRDLFVYQPGEGMERLNTAYVYGDIDLLYKTLEYNFGVIPEHYVLVHFDDLFHFVNDLGGIEVKVDTPIWDKCGGIPKGMIHMDGGEALCYVRIRQEIGDFERNQRQQDVIRATLKNALRPRNIAQMPRLYQRYSATARSDFSFTDLLAFLPLALRLQDGAGIHSFHINREETTPWEIPETHASVLLPRQDKIRALLQQAIHILEFPIPTSTALPTRLTALPATLTQMPYVPPPKTPTPAPGGIPTPAP